MAFTVDTQYAEQAGRYYGQYLASYRSSTGQVQAYLFDRNGLTMAYVYFTEGLTPGTVTDLWISEINDYLNRQGHSERVQIIYS